MPSVFVGSLDQISGGRGGWNMVTGSSDFHGRHKTVELGAYQTAPQAYEQIVAAATGVPVLG